MQEVYFPTDWDQNGVQDPRQKTLVGTLKKFFGRYLGPSNPTPAIVYLQEEKVLGQPPGVRLPWFLPYLENDTGTAETPLMRQMYRRAITFPPVKAAVLNKLFGVAALKLQIHPADKHNDSDMENADLVRWNLVRRFRGGMTHLVWQVFAPAMPDGYSVNEKIWTQQKRGKYAGKIALANLKQKDVGYDIVPKTDQFNNVTSYLGLQYNAGKEFHPTDFVHYAHLPMYERPTGMSDYRAAFDAIWLYDTTWKLRRIQLTTKSFPILKGMYEKEAQQPGLNQALRKAKALSFLTVPKGCMVEALDISGQSMDLFRNTIQDLREEIVMAINGAFLTQMAAGENVRRGDPSKHQSVTDLFKWFLSECICGYVLNDEESGLVREIVDLNHVASEYPYASLDAVSWEEMKDLADIVDKAKEWGLPISEEWAYEKFALEAPHDDVPGGDELGGQAGGMPQIGPDGQPLPPSPGAPPGGAPPGPEPNPEPGTGGAPIDAEPHKFADKGGWEPAVRMGHRGGLKGGPARARALPPERRHEIAVQGGKARQQGTHAVGIKKHDEQDETTELAEGGFDESKHPRGDDGKFIDKGELEAAKGDLNKAQELRRKVTKPEERAKLEEHLKGASWYGKLASTPPNMGATKGEVKHPERQRLEGLLKRYEGNLEVAKKELASSFPSGVRPPGASGQGYDDRVNQVKEQEQNIAGIKARMGQGAAQTPTPQQAPATPPAAPQPAPEKPKTSRSGVPPKKGKPSFATREEYDKALEAEYDKATGGKQVDFKTAKKITADIRKKLGEPPGGGPKPPSNPVPPTKQPSNPAAPAPQPQTPAPAPQALPPEAVSHLKSLRDRFAKEVEAGGEGAEEAKGRLAAVDKLLGTPPAATPTTSTHAPGSPEHVSELTKKHGGSENFAPLHKVRGDLAAAGITDPGAQEAAIKDAYLKGHVSIRGGPGQFEGLPVSGEEQAAWMPVPGDPEQRFTHLAAKQPPGASQQPAQAPVNLHDPASLASAVHEAARSIPDALGGHTNAGDLRPSESHKPLISDVYDAMKAEGQLGTASLDDFKRALLSANQAGHVTLERNDLPHNVTATPAGGGPERVGRSEITHGPAAFHVIDTNSNVARGATRHSEHYGSEPPGSGWVLVGPMRWVKLEESHEGEK